MSDVTRFVRDLAQESLENTFNPYFDRCLVCDLAIGPQCRRRMLTAVLERAQKEGVNGLWVGRDAGYLGCRRTGLPFTDVARLAQHLKYWNLDYRRPHKNHVGGRERSASSVWESIEKLPTARVLLWNVFPLHPHMPGDVFSNRRFNRSEGAVGLRYLPRLLELVVPNHIVAIGRDADNYLELIETDIPTYPVRHPSYGGNVEFKEQIRKLYSDHASHGEES